MILRDRHSTGFTTMPSRSRCCLIAVLLLVGHLGCSSGRQYAPKVDPDAARAALKTTLESWKSGGTPESLQSGPDAITVQDFDWMGGYKLVDYSIEGDGQDDDANLRIPVKLTLLDPSGKEVQKQVTYVVGTAPAVTVFREMF